MTRRSGVDMDVRLSAGDLALRVATHLLALASYRACERHDPAVRGACAEVPVEEPESRGVGSDPRGGGEIERSQVLYDAVSRYAASVLGATEVNEPQGVVGGDEDVPQVQVPVVDACVMELAHQLGEGLGEHEAIVTVEYSPFEGRDDGHGAGDQGGSGRPRRKRQGLGHREAGAAQMDQDRDLVLDLLVVARDTLEIEVADAPDLMPRHSGLHEVADVGLEDGIVAIEACVGEGLTGLVRGDELGVLSHGGTLPMGTGPRARAPGPVTSESRPKPAMDGRQLTVMLLLESIVMELKPEGLPLFTNWYTAWLAL